eukprot:GFUD01006492.1.p1 GENE.GFUD01006492.1~~GFUD01006492.1.p1  ORF type:complete len:1066 (-),score=329.83 GFUD01006492.1:50-3049(-)
MDGMKPKDTENEEDQEILDETEQFIEKLDAVERDRKESQDSQISGTQSIKASVNILVHQASVIEEPEDSYEYKAKDDTCSLAGEEEKEPEVYYRENGYPEEGIKDEDVVSIKSFSMKKTDDDNISIKSFSGKEIAEDAQSIFAGIGEDTKTVFEGGEVATEYSLYKKNEEGVEITGDYHIVERGIILGKSNEDNISVKSFTVKDDGDNVSLRSVSFNKEVSEDDDNDSVKTLTEEETKEIREDVTEGSNVNYSFKVIDYDISSGAGEKNEEADNGSVKSLVIEEPEAVDESKAKEDTASLAGEEDKEPEVSYRENGYPEEATNEDNISVRSLKKNDEEDNISVKSLAKNDDDNVSVRSFKVNDEDDNVSVRSLKVKDDDEDNVSVKSYAIEGDYILSLHQRVPLNDSEDNPKAPTPAPREARQQETITVVVETETIQEDDVKSIAESVPEPLSYEEERAKRDFESVVRDNVSKYKSDKEKTNIEVLEDIAREDGEDRPNVAQLLAWAKGTRKPKTETFVVRKKNREQLLRKSVDTGTFEVVIQDKAAQQNGVTTNETGKKKGVTTIDTGKKKLAIDSKKSAFEVQKKGEIQQSTVVTKEWLQKAVNEFENNSFANVVNMDFSLVSKGVYKATIEADVGGATKNYHWVIKDAPKSDATFNKDTFVIADLGIKMGRFMDGMKLKTPLTEPFQRVIYADKQFAIFPDISAYKQHASQQALDETHLKAGVKALAKLHAISYAYFSRSSDSEVLKLLADRHFQPAATPEDKDEAKRILEKQFENIVKTLAESDKGSALVDRVKTLKSMLYNIYKQARQSSSIFSVLCHGCPTVDNIVFLYNEDNVPVDAKFVDFSDARIASSVTDLHTFINTAGDNSAREDFLLRFVYYETLVTVLKSLGVKNDIITFDDLKKEYVKKKLYGYIESASLLCPLAKPSSGKKASVMTNNQAPNGKVVNSKILGTFVPKGKVLAVGAFSKNIEISEENEDIGSKISEMMTKAIKIN